jgi:murein tripeptide amidase MpaA
LTDAAFQRFIREPDRVAAVWRRILADPELAERAENVDRTWDNAKKIIPGTDRMQEIYNLEAAYLQTHPDSMYLTQLMKLEAFPDYIDYLPKGGIVRKLGVMGYLPECRENQKYLSISPEEYSAFTEHAIDFVCRTFLEDGLTKWK